MTPIVAARISSGGQLVSGEDEPGDHHQQRPGDQDAAPADPVGVRRQPERDQRVADEGQGQDRPRSSSGSSPSAAEVEDEDDGQEAVAEHPQRSAARTAAARSRSSPRRLATRPASSGSVGRRHAGESRGSHGRLGRSARMPAGGRPRRMTDRHATTRPATTARSPITAPDDHGDGPRPRRSRPRRGGARPDRPAAWGAGILGRRGRARDRRLLRPRDGAACGASRPARGRRHAASPRLGGADARARAALGNGGARRAARTAHAPMPPPWRGRR